MATPYILLLLASLILVDNTLVVAQVTDETNTPEDDYAMVFTSTYYTTGLKKEDEVYLQRFINTTVVAANFSGDIEVTFFQDDQCLGFHVSLTNRTEGESNAFRLLWLLEGDNITLAGVPSPVNIKTSDEDCQGVNVIVQLFVLGLQVNKANEETLETYFLKRVDSMGEWSIDFRNIGNCTMAVVNGTVSRAFATAANATLHSLNGSQVNITAMAVYNVTDSINHLCWEAAPEMPQVLNECDIGQRFCPYQKKCIPASFFCDGKNDCGDNSDERDCVQEVYAVNITVQYKWQTNLSDPMSSMFRNFSSFITAGVNATISGAFNFISSSVVNIRDGGDNSSVITVAMNFTGPLNAMEITDRLRSLHEAGFILGRGTINVTSIAQARQGPCLTRSCGDGLCVVVRGLSSQCRCMPQQSPDTCEYMDCRGVNVCQNNGTCVNDSYYGQFVCNCTQTFSGSECQVNVCQHLRQDICSGHGKCIGNLMYDTICQCDEGYGGIFCNQTGKENLTDCQRQERLNTFFLQALKGTVIPPPAFLNGKTLLQQLLDIQYDEIELSSCWGPGTNRYGLYKAVCVYKTVNVFDSPSCFCTNTSGLHIRNEYANGSCPALEKPGWCLSPQEVGTGTLECSQDVDCQGETKCCRGTVGFKCQEPTFMEVCRRLTSDPCTPHGQCIGNIFNGSLCQCQQGYYGITCQSMVPDMLTDCQRRSQLVGSIVYALNGRGPVLESINTTLGALLKDLSITKLQIPFCWPSGDMSSGKYQYICTFNIANVTEENCMCTNDAGEPQVAMSANNDCDSKYVGQQCSSFPCMNGGSCMFRAGRGQYCMCSPGFYGANCEHSDTVRLGACPVTPPGTVGIAVEYCSYDQDCRLPWKCCSNGAGHVCQEPVHYSYFNMRLNISSPWLPDYNISLSSSRIMLIKELQGLLAENLPEFSMLNITNIRPGSIIADVQVTALANVSLRSIVRLEAALNSSNITLDGTVRRITNVTYITYHVCSTLGCSTGCRCVNTTKGPTCLCPSELPQDQEMLTSDPCEKGVCQNGATCSSHLTSNKTWNYYCGCPIGTYGTNCEVGACQLFPDICGIGHCVGDLLEGNVCECPTNRKGIFCSENGSEALSKCQRKQRLSQYALLVLKEMPLSGITAGQMRQLLLAANIQWLPSYKCLSDGSFDFVANMTSVQDLQTRFGCVDGDGIEDSCETKVCSVMSQYGICQMGSQCVGNIYYQLCDCEKASDASHGALCELPGKGNETECERRRGLVDLLLKVLRKQTIMPIILPQLIFDKVWTLLEEISVNTVWQPECFPNGSYTFSGCKYKVDMPDMKECFCVDQNEERRTDIPASTSSPPQCPQLDTCQLPAVTGQCRGYIPRFYFDAKTKTCKSFIFGGCGGNENNFKSLQDCCSSCVVNASEGCSSEQPSACNNTKCDDIVCQDNPCFECMEDGCTRQKYLVDRLSGRHYDLANCTSIIPKSCEKRKCEMMVANENAMKNLQKVLPSCSEDGTFNPRQKLDNGSEACVNAFGETVQLAAPDSKCKKDPIVQITITLRYDVDFDKFAAGKEKDVERAFIERMKSFGIPPRMLKSVKVKRGSVIIEADVQNDPDVDIAAVKPLVEEKASSGELNLEVNNQTFTLASDGVSFNVTTASQVQEQKQDDQRGLTKEEIIIIAVICPVAGLGLILIIIIVAVCCCRKKKSNTKAEHAPYSKMETDACAGPSVSNNAYDMINFSSAQKLSAGVENKGYVDDGDSSGYVKVRL